MLVRFAGLNVIYVIMQHKLPKNGWSERKKFVMISPQQLRWGLFILVVIYGQS